MASLSAHLSRPEDHARLAFHPSCPQCRGERLAGSLPVVPLVSRRAQAAITAGVLAVSSIAPSAAFAAGQNEVVDGSAPEDVGTVDYDPGPASEAVSDDGVAAPDDGAPAATAPDPDDVPAAQSPPDETVGAPAPAQKAPAATSVPAEGAPGVPAPKQPAAPAPPTETTSNTPQPAASDFERREHTASSPKRVTRHEPTASPSKPV